MFKDFENQTRKSWSRPRRVVGKAEYLEKGANPRFAVTSLSAEEIKAQPLLSCLAIQWNLPTAECERLLGPLRCGPFS